MSAGAEDTAFCCFSHYKGLIKSNIVKEGKMPVKAVYSLTSTGENEFESLMYEIALQPIHFFLDFNAVIVNLPSLPPESQNACLENIEKNVKILKTYLKENIQKKENIPDIPETGMAVLQQQYLLAQAIETWLASLKDSIFSPT